MRLHLLPLAVLIWLCAAPRLCATEDHERVIQLVDEGALKLLQLMIFDPGELHDIRDSWGEGLLHHAVRHGEADVVIWLLQNGCDVDDRNRSGLTPLYFSAEAHNLEVMKILVQNGGDIREVNEEHASLLHAAAASGTPEMIEYALGLGLELNLRDERERTPLMWAADGLNENGVRTLLDHAPLVNVQDNDGRTALHHTVNPDGYGWDESTKIEIAKMLLAAGADPEIQSRYGYLPSHRTETWSLYFMLATPTSGFKINLAVAVIAASILTLIPFLILLRVSRAKPA